mmetsp:Transcript_36212/g.59479  ORF Transcript_36212/g.59479 Transcript_36212/m.59479 type:complete len:349 (+) Transcript_36212:222-1268(+)
MIDHRSRQCTFIRVARDNLLSDTLELVHDQTQIERVLRGSLNEIWIGKIRINSTMSVEQERLLWMRWIHLQWEIKTWRHHTVFRNRFAYDTLRRWCTHHSSSIRSIRLRLRSGISLTFEHRFAAHTYTAFAIPMSTILVAATIFHCQRGTFRPFRPFGDTRIVQRHTQRGSESAACNTRIRHNLHAHFHGVAIALHVRVVEIVHKLRSCFRLARRVPIATEARDDVDQLRVDVDLDIVLRHLQIDIVQGEIHFERAVLHRLQRIAINLDQVTVPHAHVIVVTEQRVAPIGIDTAMLHGTRHIIRLQMSETHLVHSIIVLHAAHIAHGAWIRQQRHVWMSFRFGLLQNL